MSTEFCKILLEFYELAFGIFAHTKRERQRLYIEVEITTLLPRRMPQLVLRREFASACRISFIPAFRLDFSATNVRLRRANRVIFINDRY